MNRWTKASNDKGIPVDYAVLGTGEAQNSVMAGEIDLAIVELPMPKNKLEMGEMVQFPVVFGAMTCVVNIEGVGDGKLRLDAELLGGIYSKSIESWRDPRIVAMNPDLRLPDIEILPVFLGRPDGSAYSTSTTLAQYLLANDADWRERFPNGLRTRWANGSMVPDAASMFPVMNAR
jgi:phosphate transport system substrate-binding protein